MQLLVYVYHPDATSLLVEELADLEEAVSICHDLVAVDGYLRAEVWDEAGEQLYGVERVGGTLRSYGVPTEGDERALPRAPSDRARELLVAAEPPGATPAAGESDTAGRPTILGEQPDRPEQWFGF